MVAEGDNLKGSYPGDKLEGKPPRLNAIIS